FFSSRRLHTRFSRDWSSDVCSSDLTPLAVNREVHPALGRGAPAIVRFDLLPFRCDLDEHFRRQIALADIRRGDEDLVLVQAGGDVAVVGCNEKVLIKPVPYFADLVAHLGFIEWWKISHVSAFYDARPARRTGAAMDASWSFRALHVIPHRAAVRITAR